MNKIIFFSALLMMGTLIVNGQEDFMPESNLIEMEMYRSACFGVCPSYRLTIYKNKMAVYKGYSNVDKEGVYIKKLSGSEYKTVCKAFKKSKFADIENNFFDNRIADAPITTLAYKVSGEMKVIRKNISWNEVLDALELKMENVGKTSGWTLKQSLAKPDKGPGKNHIENEIIVTLNKDTDAASWAKKYEDYEMQLKKKLSPRYNIWVVEFNLDRADSQEFMDIIRDDKNVKTAEFNIQVKPRNQTPDF
jgi:hypothetical protein